jgi:hypothetical protein
MNAQRKEAQTLQEFTLEAEALVAKARRLGISMVVGIDTQEQPYIASNTTMETSDTLFMTVVGLAVRHPGLLTIPQMQDKMQRLEEDAEDLRAFGVPYIIGVQPEPQGKLQILSHFPEGTMQSLHSAHLDLTITDPDMFGPTQEVPCP